MDKLTTEFIFNKELEDFAHEMVDLQMLQNSNSSSLLPLLSILALTMEYLERSSRKRKYADLDDDNEEEEDDEEDEEEEEEYEEYEEYEEEEDSDVSEQSSASYVSDARSPTNLADPFAGLDVPMIENDIKVLRAVLDTRFSPIFLRTVRKTLCELNSKLLKETAKLNGGTNGKL